MDWEIIPQMFVLLIPLTAVIGGITVGILKSNARQRLLELAQRERIAAIERGIDPAKLPALHLPAGQGEDQISFEQRQLRRSQVLAIWGLVLSAFGASLFLGIGLMEGFRQAGPAIMFLGVGIALLISSRMVRPDPADLRRPSGPPSTPTGM